ncbi:ABC transporter permease [Candidatus Similichlamydia laticola]|uniref:Spermidine Putrescine ABC transporter permease component potC n=1 Tax=Candidatus Similichlamydia laticola TaxID=2170265 RepID=A0A369KA86_9BACT|nr:ABC transporter permease [Candidatus Similichlamydia laticola]RDB31509.1 Spermidine Putrescine ABC transporter permease component potC [Candidatus Similichlamydia laticola]
MRMQKYAKFITWCVIGFCYAPILVLVVNSFNVCRSGALWEGFTLKWYRELFQASSIWKATKNSILIACTSTFIAVPIGTTSGLACHFCKKRRVLKGITLLLNKMILIIPDLQLAVGLLLFFSFIHMRLGLTTLIIAHSTFSIVYVIQSVLARMECLDFSMIEAAQDLGAKPKIILAKILFPLIRPTVLASAILTFTVSIDEFVLTSFLSGPTSPTLPLEIYGMIRNGFPPLVDTLAVLMLGFSFVASWAFQQISNES